MAGDQKKKKADAEAKGASASGGNPPGDGKAAAAPGADPKASKASPESAPSPPAPADLGREASSEPGADALTLAAPVNWSSGSRLWQVPVILISLTLIVMGLRVSTTEQPTNDFDGALQAVDELLAQDRLDEAQHELGEVIEPHLGLATTAQQARFHAAAGDWVYLSQRSRNEREAASDRRIIDQYTKAAELGQALTPAQVERCAESSLALNDVPGAQRRLTELEALAAAPGDAGTDARLRRNRVLRQLVERALRQPNASFDELMRMLADYRGDRLLSPADEAWAISRQAQLRIDDGRAEQAINRLLIDMRRIEPILTPQDGAEVGQMYTLLGRGYFALGQYDLAKYQLTKALAQFAEGGPDPVRGDAMALLGTAAALEGRHEEALEFFDGVVRDYLDTSSYLPGLLGRAEMLSILGDHPRSLADYDQLRRALGKSFATRGVTPQQGAQSMMDRHDAALAAGKLELALQYILPAEQFFLVEQVPPELLLRIASTSRQIADDIQSGAYIPGAADADAGAAAAAHGEAPTETEDTAVAHAEGTPPEPVPATPAALDPAIAHEAYLHYKRAAEYYLRHSRVVAGAPEKDASWADSLWLAADSFDLAGWHDQGAEGFRAYLAGVSESDPRRPDAMFRLGQALQAQAEVDYQPAIQTYEQLIQEYPKSPFAARSHVPLAECYVAAGRRNEAEQQLLAVLVGQRFLNPDAADYREAQLALGKLYHESGEFAKAIEQLDGAVRRYPEDSRIPLTLFRLADSYRGRAAQLRQEADQPSTSRADRERLLGLRTQHLQQAAAYFDEVIDRYEKLGARKLDRQQVDTLRYAHSYRGDCAFEMAQFDQAVEMYDFAARKYPEHHSSMIALVQIVNCYHMLGDLERARTAHARALLRLQQLPADVFDAPDALMNRAAWEAWLQNNPVGQQQVASAAPATAAP